MADDIVEQIWPVFVAETREHAQALSSGAMELERPGAAERVTPLLRFAHTMKGSAASLGAPDIERLAHGIEDVLALDHGAGLPAGAVDAILRAATAIDESLASGGRGKVPGVDDLLAALAAPLAPRPAATAGVPPSPPGELDALEAEVGALVTADGEGRRALARRARALAEALAARLGGDAAQAARRVARAAAELEGGGADVPRAIARAAADVVALREAAAAPRPPPAPAVTPTGPRAPEAAAPPDGADGRADVPAPRGDERSVRVDAGRLEAASTEVDQIVVGVSRRERRSRELLRLERAVRDATRLVQRGLAEAGLREDAHPRSLAEGLERLREVALDFGRHGRELLLEADRERVSAHTLRDALLDLRMVAAGSVLGSLRATVRDVAARLGKPVALSIVGGEVRLDRRVLDELKAPLLHLARNAVDHGIESPAARREAGKPEQATLEVRVEARRDRAVFSIRDDGRGLSPERLRAVAVQRGLLSAADAPLLSDADAAQLAFQPGITTAAEVTALSGRGVGLDVVAEAARRLGGSVGVTFERGRGTTFTLEVPLALAGSSGLLFRAAGGLAVVPADAVERVLLVSPDDIAMIAGQPSVVVEGLAVPYTTMAQALGGVAAPAVSAGGATIALLIAIGGRRAALAVDEVLGEQPIVVSPLGRRMGSARHIAGATALDDGRVVAVLFPAHLLGVSREAQPVRAAARPRVVVADDSLSTRAAAKALLELAGFQVLPAIDGEEALALVNEPGCDLVVSDVQMPRLDGLGLTRRLKADPRLAHIPVILVTSLDAPEDRAAGLKAGADAYLVKRDVQRGKLLELVRQLLPA